MSQQITPATDESVPTDGQSDQPRDTGSRRSTIATVAWLVAPALLVLALVAVAFFAWLRNTYVPVSTALRDEISQLSSQGESSAKNQRELGGEIAGVGERLEGLTRDQDKLRNDLAQLAAKPAAQPSDWMLAEIEYLLVAAAERLQVERDVNAAGAALRAADARLRAMGDPRLSPVREALASDLNAVLAIQEPDIAGLALSLADLARRVSDLSPAETHEVPGTTSPPASSPDATTTTNHDTWQHLWDSVWGELKGLVTVRKRTIAEELDLSPDVKQLIGENVRLELLNARLAVLRRDTANARASAQNLRTLLDRYYDPNTTGAVRAVLERIEQTDLAPALPDISGGLTALRAVREQTFDLARPAGSSDVTAAAPAAEGTSAKVEPDRGSGGEVDDAAENDSQPEAAAPVPAEPAVEADAPPTFDVEHDATSQPAPDAATEPAGTTAAPTVTAEPPALPEPPAWESTMPPAPAPDAATAPPDTTPAPTTTAEPPAWDALTPAAPVPDGAGSGDGATVPADTEVPSP